MLQAGGGWSDRLVVLVIVQLALLEQVDDEVVDVIEGERDLGVGADLECRVTGEEV